MKFDLLGGSYNSKYVDISSQRTINWYPSVSQPQEKGQTQYSLQPTPGLTEFLELDGQYFRGGFVARTTLYERCFVVLDQTLWEIHANQTATNRGVMSDLASGSSKVLLEVNGDQQVFIGNYQASYCFDMSANTLQKITDADFPNNIISSAYVDGYTFVVANGQVYFSDANDILSWTGSQVYHPTFKAAGTVAVSGYRDKIFNFSSETIEPYYEDGSAAIWARYPSNILYTGCLNSNTISTFDNGIIFLGKAVTGQVHVYMLTTEYLALTSLSEQNPSIQWQLNQPFNALEQAWSYIQKTKDGHIIYRLFVPDADTTYCYDLTTKEWYEQQSLTPAPNADGTWDSSVYRGKYFISFAGWNLFLDYYSGKIFYEDYTNFTEDGNPIIRTRISPIFSQEDFKNIAIDQFQIDCSRGIGTISGDGSDPNVLLYTSTDGGHTFSDSKNLTLGSYGDYDYRSRILKLGTGRRWCLKLVLSDPVNLMIQNAFINGIVDLY